MTTSLPDDIRLAIFGSRDFCNRCSSVAVAARLRIRTFAGTFAEARGILLTERPNVVVVEIGLYHGEKEHLWVTQFLRELRDRFEHEVYVIGALVAPDKLLYAGELLFNDETSMDPSGFIDTFIASPPDGIPSIPSITTQLVDALKFVVKEFHRRSKGKIPIPPLAAEGWVLSLADPKSRELWMQWLPRYASYTNESPIITGPTGTGKTRLAHAIHLLSERKGPFVSITPRDFSSSELVQAELFGAVAGAYTGAVDKWGLVKSAEQGTLFIDELQSIDKDLQGKLITFIENKTYRRVGSAETIEANVRFVFATNRTITDMVQSDILREDFAYRLERVELSLTPLHMRRLDIPAALAFSLAKIRRQRPQALPVLGCNSSSYRLLFCYSWPGNLRQLENITAKLCELSDIKDQNVVNERIIGDIFDSKMLNSAMSPSEIVSQAAFRLAHDSLKGGVKSVEQGHAHFIEILRICALEATGGDIEKASKILNESSHLLSHFTDSRDAVRELATLQKRENLE